VRRALDAVRKGRGIMEMKTYERNGFTVIAIGGRLDAESAVALKTEFSRLRSGHLKFIMDLSRVIFLDSTGLGALLFCQKCCHDGGAELRLANPGPKSKLILQITRAHRIFRVFDSLEDAISAG